MSTAPFDDVLSTDVVLCAGHCLVRLHGELDGVSSPRFAAAVDHALTVGAVVLVDLRRVTFCDLDGLRALEAARTRAARRGVDLRCEGFSPLLRRVAVGVGFEELLASPG